MWHMFWSAGDDALLRGGTRLLRLLEVAESPPIIQEAFVPTSWPPLCHACCLLLAAEGAQCLNICVVHCAALDGFSRGLKLRHSSVCYAASLS